MFASSAFVPPETMPGYVDALKDGAQTTDQAKRKILGENARKLYRL